MAKATGHILKSKDVKLEGKFRLDVGQTGPKPVREKVTASTTPQVSVVENQSEFAVIEIVCLCGSRTYIRCEYADVQSNSGEPNKTKIDGENDNAN